MTSAAPARRRRLVWTAAGVAGIAAAVVAGVVAQRATSRGARAEPTSAVAEPVAKAGPAVEVSGCAAIVDGPVCELAADRAVRIWGPTDAVFEASGRVPSRIVREIDGGALHRLVVPEGATTVRIVSGGGVRELRVTAGHAPPWLVDAKSLRQRGDLAGAAARVAPMERSRDPIESAWALGLHARLELAAGKVEAALPLFREASLRHRAAGRISDAADDGFALAFALNQRSHRYAEARAVLDDIHGYVSSYPDGQTREAYYRGTLATETGDAREGLRRLREARDHARRLGLGLLERNAINAYALQLELVGRVPEALEVLARLETEATLADDVAPCERVEIAVNIGFGALSSDGAGPGASPLDAVAPLERALALHREGGCQDTYLRRATLGNLALAAVRAGDPARAAARLAEARAGAGEARGNDALAFSETEARIALAKGEAARALAAFEEEDRLAHALLSLEGQWRAALGRGEALANLGKREEAVAQLLRAEALLPALSVSVPLGEGRGSFVGDRGKSAAVAIDLLVATGKLDAAMAVARGSRSRVVSTLARRARLEGLDAPSRARWEQALGAYRAARAAADAEALEDWKLSRPDVARAREARAQRESSLRATLDEALAVLAVRADHAGVDAGAAGPTPLPALPDDAVTIAIHPLPAGRWVALVAGGGERIAALILEPRAEVAPPEAIAARLLEPIRSRLLGTPRLRVLAYGAFREKDFHALPFDGGPLGAKVAVEYPLDLHEVEAGAAEPERGATALVVSDPTLDLARARVENDEVVRALRDGTFQVELLAGPRATSGAVLAMLPRARVFHYAGHGVFAGKEGWESMLPLAGGSRLTVGDVLASPGVPSRVVLAGCDTAHVDGATPVESLGVGQAFVVAGADFVIAPSRPVPDRVGEVVSRALYAPSSSSARGLAATGRVDPAVVLAEVVRRARQEDPQADWSAFRVLRR